MALTKNLNLIVSGNNDHISKVRGILDMLQKLGVKVIIIENEKEDLELWIPPACYRGKEIYIVLEHMVKRFSGIPL